MKHTQPAGGSTKAHGPKALPSAERKAGTSYVNNLPQSVVVPKSKQAAAKKGSY